MRLENGDYLQLCYLDFMLPPMYINTDYSLLYTLRLNLTCPRQVRVVVCSDLLGAIQHHSTQLGFSKIKMNTTTLQDSDGDIYINIVAATGRVKEEC